MRLRVIALAVASTVALAGLPVAPTVAHAASTLSAKWNQFESHAGTYDFPWAGLAAGDLFGDGHIDIVAAFPDGVVKAYSSVDGTVLWATQTDGEINGTPTLADLYNDGTQETIVATRGGSVYVWAPDGSLEPGWPRHTQDGAAKHTGFPDAFFAGVAVGQIFGDGRNFLVSTAWDHYLYVWGVDGTQANGFPINLADTAWVTPALIPNQTNSNQLDIITGADSDGGLEPYSAGGEYFRFTNSGCPSTDYLINNSNNLKQKNLKGSAACQANGGWPTQISNTAWSSPTSFDTGGGNWVTVLGSGQYFNTGNPKDCGATLSPADCGRSFRLIDPGGTVHWTVPTSHGQVLTTAAVGNLKPGDDGHDIVITDNGLQGSGSCIYAVNSAGAALPGFPICNGIVQWSNPVIGPVDNAGNNGIWIGQGGFLDSYSATGQVLTSTRYGDGTGYLPGAPVLFNNGGGVEVAAIGANTRAGGAYNQWQVSVFNVDPNGNAVANVGQNAFPRYHFDNNDDGRAQRFVAPSVPYNVGATAADGAATVSFHSPADIGSATPTSYDIAAYDKNGNVVTTQGAATSPATVTGLTNGQPYYFRVRAQNGTAGDWSVTTYSVTPYPAATPAAATNNTVAAAQQYRLPYSDGSTWQDLDPTHLSFSVAPTTSATYQLTGNVDLWTSNSGYNQDVGICVVTGSTNCNAAPGNIIAWKESGGNAGIFSPNAAAVQGTVAMTAGTAYTVKLVWKSSRPAKGASIWAAAGGAGNFSPSRLSARALSVVGNLATAQQGHLDSSDGSTWVNLTTSSTSVTFTTGAVAAPAVLSGNVDLWTGTPGYNQDVGIRVTSPTDPAFATGKVVAWKESGGNAGIFSPNAAYVDTAIAVLATTSYTASLVWKSNKAMALAAGQGIYFGAGSAPAFSPTTLIASVPTVPTSSRVFAYPVSPTLSRQYSMFGNQNQWTPLDDSHYDLTLSPPTPSCLTVVSVNVDLWTANPGFNQDIGIALNGGAANVVAWKESGGNAGTFSPNAAFVEYVYTASAGDIVRVLWKSSAAGGATIFAGAGSASDTSPTTLMVQYLC